MALLGIWIYYFWIDINFGFILKDELISLKHCEFHIDESPFDIYTLNPDVLRWTLSIQDGKLSGSDIFPGSLDPPPEGPGHFEDQFLTKDDDDSVTSSMDDSAYMSQSDTSRRAAPSGDCSNEQVSLEKRSQTFEGFLYSPALSSENHRIFQGSSSDMNHLLIPSIGDHDAEEMNLGVTELTSFAANPSYGRSMGYDMANPPLSSPFVQGNDMVPAFGWTPISTPTFGANYSMGTVDENIFSHPVQVQQDTTNHRARGVRSSISDDTASQHSQQRAAQQPVRPRLQRMDGSLNSKVSDDTATSNFSFTHENIVAETSNRLQTTEQQVNNYGSSYLTSPTSRTASISALDTSAISDHAKGVSSIFSVQGERRESQKEPELYAQADSVSGQNAEDADGKKARTHSLYQATPGDDELYHCPHEGQPGCGHKPTKLKCNYDKYVDSHLRPFRCKNNVCTGVQFSSTACLLRHEREAHGMHGHGNKPHLCTFPGCERSLPEHGFPRRYNLFDHMKRVHDYTGPPSPSEKDTTVQGQSITKRQVNRKRKASTEITEQVEKKSKVIPTREPPAPPPRITDKKQEISKLQDEWTQQRILLVRVLHDLQMQDVKQYQHITDKLAELKKLSEKYASFDERG